MSDDKKNDHEEMLRLLRENTVLVKENNVLLKKLHRHNMIGLAFKIVWIAIIIGLPFALYFYILEPYFKVLGANYEVFQDGVSEIPGLKMLEGIIPHFGM